MLQSTTLFTFYCKTCVYKKFLWTGQKIHECHLLLNFYFGVSYAVVLFTGMLVSFTVSLCHMLAVLCYLLAFVSFTGVVLFTGVTAPPPAGLSETDNFEFWVHFKFL